MRGRETREYNLYIVEDYLRHFESTCFEFVIKENLKDFKDKRTKWKKKKS